MVLSTERSGEGMNSAPGGQPALRSSASEDGEESSRQRVLDLLDDPDEDEPLKRRNESGGGSSILEQDISASQQALAPAVQALMGSATGETQKKGTRRGSRKKNKVDDPCAVGPSTSGSVTALNNDSIDTPESEADVLSRTVHVQYLPVTMTEGELSKLINSCGQPRRVRICGNPMKDHNWIFGFVEYETPDGAAALMVKNGMRMGTYKLRCTMAKTQVGDKLPSDATKKLPCSFGKHHPDRTLRDALLSYTGYLAAVTRRSEGRGPVMMTGKVQTSPNALQQQASGDIAREDSIGSAQPSGSSFVVSQGPVAAPLSSPNSTALTLLPLPRDLSDALHAAMRCGAKYCKDSNPADYSETQGHLNAAYLYMNAHKDIAHLLEAQLCAHCISAAVHCLKNANNDAIKAADDMLALLPTPDVPFSFVALNYTTALGLLLEHVSPLIARCFYIVAQRRAAAWKPPVKCPMSLEQSVEEGTALFNALFPLLLRHDVVMFSSLFFSSQILAKAPEDSATCSALPMCPLTVFGAR